MTTAETTDSERRARAAAKLLGLRVGIECHSSCAGLNKLQQYTVYCQQCFLYVHSRIAHAVGVVLAVSLSSYQ